MNTRANDLRRKVIYSVFVRNHTPEGTFQALEGDLDRLRALGTDILWLMPIHPIGAAQRKGTLGSPYAIRDYRAINPEYGTAADFLHLVEEIHRRGMQCIIDVVFRHTSPDSVLAAAHPEYFLRDEAGNPVCQVAEWWDIVDLDYSKAELWAEQIETLKLWARIVDGFRCDVASAVPVEFWQAARAAVETVRPGCLWLAESVHPSYTLSMRRAGIPSATDTELYRAFDMTYDYDVWPWFEGYLSGQNTLREYINLINFQEAEYPGEYVKVRFLENHDQERAASRLQDENILRSWLAFSYFEKGAAMLYSGGEFAPRHRVSLFDADDCYGDKRLDLQPYLRQLKAMKIRLPVEGAFSLAMAENDIIVGCYDGPTGAARGVFPMAGRGGTVAVGLPDGVYTDWISGERVAVQDGQVHCRESAFVIGGE